MGVLTSLPARYGCPHFSCSLLTKQRQNRILIAFTVQLRHCFAAIFKIILTVVNPNRGFGRSVRCRSNFKEFKMEHEILIIVACICVTVLVVAAMYIRSVSQNESQRTLQKALDSNTELTPELLALVQVQRQDKSDIRRGIFLVVASIASGGVLFFAGGIAWMFAGIPLVVGLTYLVLPSILSRK